MLFIVLITRARRAGWSMILVWLDEWLSGRLRDGLLVLMFRRR